MCSAFRFCLSVYLDLSPLAMVVPPLRVTYDSTYLIYARNSGASPAAEAGRRGRTMEIRPFQPTDEAAVVALWEACGLTRPWNDPRKDVRRKLLVQPELFLVGVLDGRVAATVMAGYD